MYERRKTNPITQVAKSRALTVIVVVLAVNFALACFNPFGKTTVEELPKDHSWISWALQDFLAQPNPSDVVFIGSSLVLHPLTMLDARHLNKTLDYTSHHRSVYTEDQIEKRLGVGNARCFNFAMPGGMVSDDWMIVESLMKGDRKPKVIVLGLTARDFIDNKVRHAGTTPVFEYLSKSIDMEPVLDLAWPQLADRKDYLIGKIAYLWEVKPAVQALLSDAARAFANDMCLTSGGAQFSDSQLEKLLAADVSTNLERGMMVERPDTHKDFIDNTVEYADRYRDRHDSLFKAQRLFFEKLLASAKERDIRVLVLNMPLTTLNVKMLPAGVYDEYLATVRDAANRYGFAFADLHDDTRFPSSVFYDTVHLNANGGQRLVDAIVDEFGRDKSIATKLREVSDTGIASSAQSVF